MVFREPAAKLAFDHKQILKICCQTSAGQGELQQHCLRTDAQQFRLSELQNMYEIIINDKLDKEILESECLRLLQETGEKDISGAHRPAMLYQFKKLEIKFSN